MSAEAFGAWNTKKAFVAQKILKSAETIAGIRSKLNMSFMFSSLDEREQEIVIDAMEEKIAVANEKIIVEGDLGDCLYVVGSGTLTCTKVF